MTHSIYDTFALNIPVFKGCLALSPPPEALLASMWLRFARDGGVDFGEKFTSLQI